jgi:hypothetical protein
VRRESAADAGAMFAGTKTIEELLPWQYPKGISIDDFSEAFYNYPRPHAGLGGKTPYERLVEKMR